MFYRDTQYNTVRSHSPRGSIDCRVNSRLSSLDVNEFDSVYTKVIIVAVYPSHIFKTAADIEKRCTVIANRENLS